MSSGDVLLLAAGHGLINVIKFFESPSYPVTYTNAFGDSLLHYAAWSGNHIMCLYLLWKGVSPNVENKF